MIYFLYKKSAWPFDLALGFSVTTNPFNNKGSKTSLSRR